MQELDLFNSLAGKPRLWVCDNVGMGTSALNQMSLVRTLIECVRPQKDDMLAIASSIPPSEFMSSEEGFTEIEMQRVNEGVVPVMSSSIEKRVRQIKSDLA